MVRGREPTVVGQANMLSSFVNDDEGSTEPSLPVVPVDSGGSTGPSLPVVPVDSDADMRLYHLAFASHRPEPNESNAESADRSRRIDDQVEALKDPFHRYRTTHG